MLTNWIDIWYLHSDESDEDLSTFWRKGQPPRSDVAVKLVNQKPKLPTAAERVANKILVGPIHKVIQDIIWNGAKYFNTWWNLRSTKPFYKIQLLECKL